jgi:hypothetical protein
MVDRRGRGTLRLKRVGRFARITAVVVNADGQPRRFRAGEWRYRHDNARFELRVRR